MAKIAAVLGVPVDYLILSESKHLVNEFVSKNEVSDDEMRIVKAYRNADSLTQQMIIKLLDLEKEKRLKSSKEA